MSCAKTGLGRSCAKTNSNTGCYTNSGSNSNSNNRLHDVLRPKINNNKTEGSSSGHSTEINANNHSNSNFNNRSDNTPLSNNNENIFFQGKAKSDKNASIEVTKQLQKECEDVFTGIGCFHGMFSLQVKPDSKIYQMPPWHIAYAPQKLFEEE